MADLARIKGNVRKMVDQGAPEFDIDQYINMEGSNVNEIKAFKITEPTPDSFSVRDDVARPALRATRSAVAGTIGAAGDIAQMVAHTPNPLMGLMDTVTGSDVAGKVQRMNQAQPMPSEVLKGAIDRFTGNLTAPRNDTEKNIDIASEFAAGGGAELPFMAARGAKALVKATPVLLGKMGRKTLKNDVLQAAAEEGITLNPSAITNNRTLQFIESRVAQSGLSGKSYDDLVKHVDDSYVDAYTRNLDEISKQKYLNPTEAGTSVQTALDKQRSLAQAGVREKYDNVIAQYGSNPVSPEKTVAFIDKSLEKLSKSASHSDSKKVVINKLNETKASLLAKQPDIETLINTKTDLNDIINYETQGGVKQYLKGVIGSISDDLKGYGIKDLGFQKSFGDAENAAKVNAKTFRNKLVDSMMKNQRPEDVLGMINRPSDVAKVDLALGNSIKMQKVSQAVKRMKLEQILGDSLGEAQYGKAVSKLSANNKYNSLIKALAGDRYANLENLRTVASGISDGKKFFNFSKSGNVAQDVSLIMSSVVGTFTGNPGAIAFAASPYALSKVITSKTLMNALTKVVKAQKIGINVKNTAAGLAFVDLLKKQGFLSQ